MPLDSAGVRIAVPLPGLWFPATSPALNGTMLWFDEAKGHGYVLTDEGERLRVDRDGFVDGLAPVGRCARRQVNLSVDVRGGQRIAVGVSLVSEEAPRRARRRSSSGRSSW